MRTTIKIIQQYAKTQKDIATAFPKHPNRNSKEKCGGRGGGDLWRNLVVRPSAVSPFFCFCPKLQTWRVKGKGDITKQVKTLIPQTVIHIKYRSCDGGIIKSGG